MRIDRRRLISRRGISVVAIVVLELVVGYLDYAVGSRLPLANLHFVPIVLAAVYFGYTGALATSVAAVAIFHLSHFFLPGRPVYFPEADLLRLAFFVLIGLVTARLADDRQRLREYARAADKRSAELAALNAELARVSAEKSRLVAVASHEVRAPLAVIMGNAQMLQREALEPRIERRLQHIQAASRQLLHTVNNILDRSSIEAGRLQLALERVDLVDLAEEYLRLYGDLLQGHTVSLVAANGETPVLADREKIGRVLVNLLSNAAKYSPAGKPIIVRVTAEDGTVSIEVADEGPGIAAAERERIFDAYYRSDGAGPLGVGLGLAICKEIVAAHGGRVGVRAGVPTGSVFYLTLPAAPRAVGQVSHAPEPAPPALAAGRR